MKHCFVQGGDNGKFNVCQGPLQSNLWVIHQGQTRFKLLVPRRMFSLKKTIYFMGVEIRAIFKEVIQIFIEIVSNTFLFNLYLFCFSHILEDVEIQWYLHQTFILI